MLDCDFVPRSAFFEQCITLMDQHPVVICKWIISDELSSCVNKAKLHIWLNVIRVVFETTSQAKNNFTVRAVGVWSSLVLIFSKMKLAVRLPWHLASMCMWWMNSCFHMIRRRDIEFATVSCSQDVVTTPMDRQSPEHFKVSVETSYNFSLWRHFLASLLAPSVDPWFLLMGLHAEQCIWDTPGRITQSQTQNFYTIIIIIN